jgi:hypothetical protein
VDDFLRSGLDLKPQTRKTKQGIFIPTIQRLHADANRSSESGMEFSRGALCLALLRGARRA